jgi:hypothetical protein
LADQHPENPQSWNLYAYTLNNPLKYIDPDGAAVMYAPVVLGTASFKVYKPEGNFDAAAMLMTFWPTQIGTGRRTTNQNLEGFKQNQSSWWYPTQVSWENNQLGGCTLGCATTFSEQAIGVTLNLSFNYDQNDNLTGANISWAQDPGASFIGPNPSPMATTLSMMPGGLNPMPQALRVDINSSALKNLSPQQLQALAKAAGNVPIAAVRQALTSAVSQEQKRRADEEKKKQQCQQGQNGCPSSK